MNCSRLLRFFTLAAKELLLPDFLEKPVNLAIHFHRCFVAQELSDKLLLLREARELSSEQVESFADELAQQWKGIRLNEAQRALLRQLVRCLHDASENDADDSLRKSLNRSLANPAPLAAAVLHPEKVAVGRSLFQAILTRQQLGPRPLNGEIPELRDYEPLSILGEGGFGTVYLMRHHGQLRAVKMGELADWKRFEREVVVLQELKCDSLVRYFDHGVLGDRFWIAMEYLGEITLADVIRAKPTTEQAFILGRQILQGLNTLHSAGVVHRDLKPENIMVAHDFHVRLIDFGLSKDVRIDRVNTLSAELVGTPRYMSPEQFHGTPTPAATMDLWSFGCIFYELLTGKALFRATNAMSLGYEIMTSSIDAALKEVVPQARPLLRRCLQRDVAKRKRQTEKLLADFQAAQKTLPSNARQSSAMAWLQWFFPVHAGKSASKANQADLLATSEQTDKPHAKKRERFLANVPAVAFHPNGSQYASVCWDSRIRVTDIETQQIVCRQGIHEIASSLLWTADGSQLISAGADKRIKIWDAEGKLLLDKESLTGPISCLALSRDQRFLISGGASSRVVVWEGLANSERHFLKCDADKVSCVALSADGRYLAAGDGDKVRLWELPCATPIMVWPIPRATITSLVFSADGQWLFTADSCGMIRTWDFHKGKEIARPLAHPASVESIDLSPDGTKIASGGAEGYVRIWDSLGRCEEKYKAHNHMINCVRWSPDGSQVLSCSLDHSVLLRQRQGYQKPES
jgi:serine/threonine protein kinase